MLKGKKQEKNDKLETSGKITVNNRFIRWLDNFWYHHKWAVIVVAFFVFVGVVCFVQCSTTETGDIKIVFAGGYTLNDAQKENIAAVFEMISPEKEDGSRLSVLLNDFSVYSEDEMRKLSTDDDGNFSVMTYENMNQVSKNNLDLFGTYIMAGESCIWLVNETVYENQNLKKLAVPLAELFEQVPDGAYDEYAFYLSDTALYRQYDALKVLPEDTLIVFSQRLYINPYFDEAAYEENRQMYRAIVDFKKP